MSMISLKRGSSSGSNGGIYFVDLFVDFRKGPIWHTPKEVQALNHLQEVQHITLDVLNPKVHTSFKKCNGAP
jgi:hypothetical protein